MQSKEDNGIIDEPIKELLIFALSKRTLLLELFTTLGIPNTLKLITYFSGAEIKIPSKYDIQVQVRQIFIHYMATTQEKSLYEIARTFKMSEVDIQAAIKLVGKLKKELEEERKIPTDHTDLSLEEMEEFILNLEIKDTDITKENTEQ